MKLKILTITVPLLMAIHLYAQPSGMALIPAGPFTMGDPLDGESDAIPTVTVNVSAFYMDVNLVSYSQWQSVYTWATSHGYNFVHAGSADAAINPVYQVDWFDAVKWCNARSQQTGKTPVYYTDAGFTKVYTNGEVTPYVNWANSGYRLPTEAEWEKAARGGLNGQRFQWGNTISENQANYSGCTECFNFDMGPDGYNAAFTGPNRENGDGYTSPVGYFAPNNYGLYDMAGNVSEWCWDWYGTPYAGGTDPHGPASGSERILRGGTWNSIASELTCAYRDYYFPTWGNSVSFGFRCVSQPHALDYFGIGVDWQNVTSPPGLSGVRGDIGASDLFNHLKTDLSSTFGHGTVVPLDATATTADNLNTISTQFNSFSTSVGPNDTIVLYVATHGGILTEYGLPAVELVVSDDATNPNNIELDAIGIENLLNLLPSSTRKVVILESCHAGGIGKYLADNVSNISILCSSSPSYQIIDGIIYGGVSFAAPDGTGVFTDSLIAELDRGIFSLNQIVYDIDANNGALYTTLLGQNLYLEDSGTAVFTGLQPQLYEGPGFTGNLASNTVTVVQSPPKISKVKSVGNTFQMTLTNVPSSGSIAIEVSTNLNSWLQVAFSPAAGTNLSYSFSTTNAPYQIFRTKVVP